jgi:hypothetical protein
MLTSMSGSPVIRHKKIRRKREAEEKKKPSSPWFSVNDRRWDSALSERLG